MFSVDELDSFFLGKCLRRTAISLISDHLCVDSVDEKEPELCIELLDFCNPHIGLAMILAFSISLLEHAIIYNIEFTGDDFSMDSFFIELVCLYIPVSAVAIDFCDILLQSMSFMLRFLVHDSPAMGEEEPTGIAEICSDNVSFYPAHAVRIMERSDECAIFLGAAELRAQKDSAVSDADPFDLRMHLKVGDESFCRRSVHKHEFPSRTHRDDMERLLACHLQIHEDITVLCILTHLRFHHCI